jgi:hypothetical protein
MSQDNNRNDRERQADEQPEGWQQDEQMAREGRSQPESEPIQAGITPQDMTPAADDLDDMDEDDDDRDDDDRDDGSPNRRRNIG